MQYSQTLQRFIQILSMNTFTIYTNASSWGYKYFQYVNMLYDDYRLFNHLYHTGKNVRLFTLWSIYHRCYPRAAVSARPIEPRIRGPGAVIVCY